MVAVVQVCKVCIHIIVCILHLRGMYSDHYIYPHIYIKYTHDIQLVQKIQ